MCDHTDVHAGNGQQVGDAGVGKAFAVAVAQLAAISQEKGLCQVAAPGEQAVNVAGQRRADL